MNLLSSRGIAARWAASSDPREALRLECRALARDATFMASLTAHLESAPIIQASCRSMLAQLAMAAGVRWTDTDAVLHPLSRRGWHISRWLPTFLLISGPLGRLLVGPASPLWRRLRDDHARLPLLADARDAFNHDTFREIRNAFGHWSFEWLESDDGAVIRAVDWKTGREKARLTVLECEALHFLTFSVVEAIDVEWFRDATAP